MARRRIITDPIPDLATPWSGIDENGQPYGYDKEQVEALVKGQFKKRFGAIRTTVVDNYIHILGFATEADATNYMADPTTYASLLIQDFPTQIAASQGDSYYALLSTDRSTSTQYLVKDGDSFDIHLRLNAIHSIQAMGGAQEYLSGNGTLYVEQGTNGSDFPNVTTFTIQASSNDSGYPTTINLKGLLANGRTNHIRLRATFPYIDNEGEAKTMGTTPIILTIASVTLSLSMNTSWRDPMIDPSVLQLIYNVSGSVSKTLYLKVTGSAGTYIDSRDLSSADTTVTFNINENSNYGLLTHGVKTCEAWLEAGDSNSGLLESDHVETQVMVVRSNIDPSVYLKPRLLIQKVLTKVNDSNFLVAENFVQTRLLSYAVYSPIINEHGNISNTGPSIQTTFILTNSAGSILSGGQNIYTSMLVNPSPGTAYDLDMTMEIEQDGSVITSFLHATRDEDGTTKDFLSESTGIGFILVRVDNSGGFQPTANSTFLLNPKTRNNAEDTPKTILNMKADNEIVPSTWDNFKLGNEDGYIKDENGESCLCVPAGRLLTIGFNPFGQLYTSPNASVNIEFDMCVRNVTNEDDPIIKIAEEVNGTWRGLRMLPMIGYMTTESWQSESESDFRWSEDERTHVSINIVNTVFPNAHDDALVTADKQALSKQSLPLVRIFINGRIKREIVYNPSSTEFCTGPMSNGGIVIGQVGENGRSSGADTYIFGIRVWENSALTSEQVHQDFTSTIPSSDEKRRERTENAIINPNTGLIDLELVVGADGIHKNALVWHGNEAYHENAYSGSTGWIESWRYDNEGNYIPELSGTVCRETKSIPQKPQGTTAKTYYYHNLQWDIHKSIGMITISPNDLHESITAVWVPDYEWEGTEDVGAWSIKGGYLGKDFPHPDETPKYYHGTEESVIVPDGWIDGNGKYRGVGYQVAFGVPMFQKGVNKINYASAMQSHLIGINWLYNELHTAICGKNTMQNAVDGAVVAKHTEPFLFFTQAEGAQNAVFRGPCAFGAGKMDKPSWGYVKSKHADFCMIEGADNDKPLTDMRVPFDNEPHGSQPAKVFYDPAKEAFYYRLSLTDDEKKEKCIDFDAGKTDNNEYPTTAIIGYIKAAWNFLYEHAPRIRHYDGSLTDFLTDASWAQRSITVETTAEERARIELAQSRVKTANKYWCHAEGVTQQGDYLLKRYDFCENEWVDAGLWDSTNNRYEPIDLRTYPITSYLFGPVEQGGLTPTEQEQSDIVNKAVIKAIVLDARNHIGEYFKVSSLKFHYAFENHFIAGTDNCSKNTYYVLDPATHLFELHQDDVDTTLATDNSAFQSKPYYIDRMHPFDGNRAAETSMSMAEDLTPENCMYEGYYNVLFDLCELMWEPNDIMGQQSLMDLPNMLNDIFKQMTLLNGGLISDASSTMVGVWKNLNRYIFDIQRYFPAVVFNEAARIRYELPELIGFTSDVRGVRPIKQSIGDQLEAETQFMRRRLVYMASYAAFGEFTAVGIRGGDSTGLDGAGDNFGMTPATSASSYVFHLVPHQWIYPTGSIQTNNLENPHVRVAPGAVNMPNEYFALDLSMSMASDQGVSVLGLNYYRELGNLGDMVANNGQNSFRIDGRRLIKFVAQPTVSPSAFRVGSITIGTATRLREFNVNGASIGTGTLDVSKLTLCETIDTRGTGVSQVRLPQTSTLTTVKLPAGITTLKLENLPSLASVSLEGYNALASLTVTKCPLLTTATRTLVFRMKESGSTVTYIDIDNINWQAQTIDGDTVRWLLDVGDAGTCKLSGRITMASTSATPSGRLYYDDVARLIRRYGNIYDSTIDVTDNGLFINFSTAAFTSEMLSISGRKYINPSELDNPVESNGNVIGGYYSELGLDVAGAGNNVAAVQKTDGTWTPDVKWTIQTADMAEYAEIEDVYSSNIHILMVSQVTMVVRVTVTDTNGVARYAEKTIGLWRRVPQVGDFAWTDGEFDNENDASKALAGLVVMRQMCNADDQVITDVSELHHYKLWVYSYCGGTNASANNVTMPRSNTTQYGDSNNYSGVSTQCWGMYPVAGGSSVGLNDNKTNGVYDEDLLAAIAVATGRTDIFDTPLTNRSGDAYLRKDAAAVTAAGSGIAMQDETKEDGWATQTLSYMTNMNSKGERDTLLAYADTVLQAVLNFIGYNDNEHLNSPDYFDSENHVHPQTPQALANLTQMLVKYADDHNVANPTRYREFMFPAARLADTWCPVDVGTTQDEKARIMADLEKHGQYDRGKWMLPSSGLLARIFNFLGNSRSGYNTSAAPSETYHNENVVEAKLPLFSNAMHRGRTVPVSYSSSQWSSTEYYRGNARYVSFSNGNAGNITKYNGTVVRPVAAFNFVP